MILRPRLFLIAFALILLSATSLVAAGGGEAPERTPLGWFFRWANFAVLAGALAYLLVKKVPGAFRNRAETIAAAIAEAGNVRIEAERRLQEAEEKIAKLDQEMAELRAAAQRDAAAEAERIRRLTADETEKIARAAHAEIEAAERTARMELKAIAARMATERAEEILYRKLTPGVHAALLRSFVDRLARSAS